MMVRTAYIAIGTALSLAAVSSADPIGVTFNRITNNANNNIAGQLSCVITDEGGGIVKFRLQNNVGIASGVHEIYVDDTSHFGGIDHVFESTGVNYTQFGTNVNPGNLPAGNTVSFAANTALSADAQGRGKDYLDALGEYLDMFYTLTGGTTWSDIEDGFGDGSIRVGMHVGGIAGGPGGPSDSFVSNPPPPPPVVIPLPSAGFAGLAGLGALAALRRRIG
ncbi:MAG: hypothetical protein H7Y88_01275 [Phycisphaerales bacterium]|nr:hypothetical protein [Phycisphaerales bacterium]